MVFFSVSFADVTIKQLKERLKELDEKLDATALVSVGASFRGRLRGPRHRVKFPLPP